MRKEDHCCNFVIFAPFLFLLSTAFCKKINHNLLPSFVWYNMWFKCPQLAIAEANLSILWTGFLNNCIYFPKEKHPSLDAALRTTEQGHFSFDPFLTAMELLTTISVQKARELLSIQSLIIFQQCHRKNERVDRRPFCLFAASAEDSSRSVVLVH